METINKMYKILDNNMLSPYQYMRYHLGEEYICHDFDGSDEVCSRGFSAVPIEGLVRWFRKDKQHRVFECEVGGRRKVFDIYKQRYEKIKLTREVSDSELVALAQKEETARITINLNKASVAFFKDEAKKSGIPY